MTSRTRTLAASAVALVAATALVGCATVQDTFQIGEREFRFPTAAEAEQSGESFRFQGFLPDDATDVRLVSQLDGNTAVMRWTSPTPFSSEHCSPAPVTSEPRHDVDWGIDPLPTDGIACGIWTIVRSGETHIAWNDPSDS